MDKFKQRCPFYYRLRDLKTGREFNAEWSDMAGEFYEEKTGTPHQLCDVEIIVKDD